MDTHRERPGETEGEKERKGDVGSHTVSEDTHARTYPEPQWPLRHVCTARSETCHRRDESEARERARSARICDEDARVRSRQGADKGRAAVCPTTAAAAAGGGG